MINKSKIKKILVVSLSNIGDVVLTFPVIDILKNDFPEAKISVIVGPKAELLLKDNPYVDNVFIFHKRQSFVKTFKWLLGLRKHKFDMIIDLRNTAIPFILGASHMSSPIMKRLKGKHMRLQHLNRLKTVHSCLGQPEKRYALFISRDDKDHVDNILENKNIENEKIVVVSPGAANPSKCWTIEGFASVCDSLIDEFKVKICFVGDLNDRAQAQNIIKEMHNSSLNLCGRTSLTQTACLFSKSILLITNDSAPLHIGSYMDVPVLALFGPTDPARYGPWSKTCYVVENSNFCSACKNEKKFKVHECMNAIPVSDVLDAAKMLIQAKEEH